MVTKLKKSICEKKFQNSNLKKKTQIVTKLKNSNFEGTKLKSNCDKT